MARSSHTRNERFPLFATFSPTSQKSSMTHRPGISTKIKEFIPKQTDKPTVGSSDAGHSGKIGGSVKWFDVKKGYGFIRSDVVGDIDIFVHQRDIHADGVRILLPGEKVEFQLEREADGRFRALFVTGPNGSYVYGAENVNKIRSGRPRVEAEDHPAPFWYGPPANTPSITVDPEHRQISLPVLNPASGSNFPFYPVPAAASSPTLTAFHPGWGAPMGSITVMPPYSEYIPYVVRPPSYAMDETGVHFPPFQQPTAARKPLPPSGPTDSVSAFPKSLESVELRDLESKLALTTPQSSRSPAKSSEDPRSPSDTPQRRRISGSGIKAILSGIDREGNLKTDSITGSWRRASVPGTLDVSPSASSEGQSTMSSHASPTTSVTSSNSTPVSATTTTTPESIRSEASPATSQSSSSPPSLSSPALSVSQVQGERGKVLALPLKASEKGVYLKKGKQGQKRWEKKLKSAQETVKENPESTVWMLNDGVFSLGDDARILREMGFTHIVWIPE